MRRALFYFGVAGVLLYTLFPFYWALNGSLQPSGKIFSTPANYFPSPISLESYRAVWRNTLFVRALGNSAVVASGATLLSLAIGAFAAYALGRFRIRGRRAVLSIVLSMTMFPQISILGAMYTLISNLGLYNRPAGLILSYLLFTLPLTVWVLTNFFRAMPMELEESAWIDGAGPLRTFWSVLLPLSLPAVVTTALLSFIAAWNEYLFALTFTVTEQAKTVPVVIAGFSGEQMHETPWGSIMAASVVVTVPLIALALIFQRRIISGLTSGAVKG